jgi:hypothetical protein
MRTFPTASEARAGSRNNLAVHAEIRAIEQAIYQAIEEGELSVDVGKTVVSPMTDPQSYDPSNEAKTDARDYYGVLFAEVDNRSLKEQIDIVQKNFVDLGYQVTPLKNTSTGNTFFWRILW